MAAEALLFILLAKLAPYRPSLDHAYDIPFDELSRRYAKWDLISFIPCLIFTALFTFIWFYSFKFLQAAAHNQLPPSQFILDTPNLFWVFPAFFLALISTGNVMWVLYSYILGDRFFEYIRYGNIRSGIDGLRVFRWLTYSIVGLSLLVVPLSIDCYTRFSNSAVIENSFFSLGETEHPYSDIKEIREIATFRTPMGEIVNGRYHQIIFKDDFKWSTRDGLRDADAENDHVIIKFVSNKSRIPITQFLIAPD